MCKIRCPLCRKRICDLIAIAEGRTVVRIRCPHCGSIAFRILVKAVALLHAFRTIGGAVQG